MGISINLRVPLADLISTSSLVRFGNFLEEDALTWVFVGVEGEFVVVVFLGIDYIFGEV